MPAQQSVVSQILAEAAKDTRAQPWKAALTNTAHKDGESEDKEIVKTAEGTIMACQVYWLRFIDDTS
ncbi:hypothetical protein ACMFMG_008799 [Clarireedia jacksonii]